MRAGGTFFRLEMKRYAKAVPIVFLESILFGIMILVFGIFAVQAVGSILWAIVIPKFKSLKLSYVLSLIIGAIGFISVIFIHDKYLLLGSYFLVGAAWAAMLALPFTLLTNSLSGEHLGSYLGLFNCTICLPQIVAAALGGVVLRMVGNSQAGMLVLAGILLLCGSAAVSLIKGKK